MIWVEKHINNGVEKKVGSDKIKWLYEKHTKEGLGQKTSPDYK